MNQYDMDGKFIREWDSLTSASDELGFGVSALSKCCHGDIKSVGGYKWRYKDDVSRAVEFEEELERMIEVVTGRSMIDLIPQGFQFSYDTCIMSYFGKPVVRIGDGGRLEPCAKWVD